MNAIPQIVKGQIGEETDWDAIISSFAQRNGATSHYSEFEDIMATQNFRQEKDSIGIKEIPADVYYGVQTAGRTADAQVSLTPR